MLLPPTCSLSLSPGVSAKFQLSLPGGPGGHGLHGLRFLITLDGRAQGANARSTATPERTEGPLRLLFPPSLNPGVMRMWVRDVREKRSNG